MEYVTLDTVEKDYYKVLGVPENATAEDIKKNFKELAKKYHPDANKGKKESEERFKEISEAYDVLGNSDSRREYDLQREARRFTPFGGGGYSGSRGGSPFSFETEFMSGNIDDLLRQFSGGFGGAENTRGKSRRRSQFSGFGNPGGSGHEDAETSATLKVPLKIACAGGTIQVSGLPGGSQRIQIPPGTKQGTRLSTSTSEGPFSLKVFIEDDPPFTLAGDNIEASLSLNIAQAVLGCKIKLKEPRGSELILTIPPGSQPGDKLRLRGQGLAGGDLLVKLEVVIPRTLSDEERDLFTKFANVAGMKL
ncbi:MAG: J domain-containing protein [Candidatus Riflebacteria bacterium]|nr:J domain-containing protein [Candidatus Riflebacteria bacterium]